MSCPLITWLPILMASIPMRIIGRTTCTMRKLLMLSLRPLTMHITPMAATPPPAIFTDILSLNLVWLSTSPSPVAALASFASVDACVVPFSASSASASLIALGLPFSSGGTCFLDETCTALFPPRTYCTIRFRQLFSASFLASF